MTSATLLLPARARLAEGSLPGDVSKALGRADRHQAPPGAREQLRRHFQLIPDHWPVAALTRQLDRGDAIGHAWLLVEPAHVAPDMGGARMLSHGPGLALDERDVAELLPALRPLFGDAGFPLDAPTPGRWYLQLPAGARLPEFSEPSEVLGEDLFAHLPDGELGRRWRALLNEAQVVLHNHPWNAARAQQGKPAVNSLWFWGAGMLPDFVRTGYQQVKGSDLLLRALARAAGVLPGTATDEEAVDTLIDLRQLRSASVLGNEALGPLLVAIHSRELDRLVLDFADGEGYAIERAQRWRFWRRPISLAEAP